MNMVKKAQLIKPKSVEIFNLEELVDYVETFEQKEQDNGSGQQESFEDN
jgi:hypothetical protein